MSEKAIVAIRLERSYGTFKAVDGISLEVDKGEVFGLLGPNGAGKTTTFSMLTGIVPPSSGSVRVNGVDVVARPRDARFDIGVVPQNLALYTPLTALDNLRFFGGIYGLRGKRLQQRIDLALEVAGLTGRARDVVDTYSGGMKRRLNLAVALLHEPKVLFLDEPTVGIDPQSRNAIFECIESLKQQGLTVVYTTHYMEEAERLCQRIAIIDRGRIIATDTPDNLKQLVGEGQFTVGIDGGDPAALVETLRSSSTILDVRPRDGLIEVEARPLQEALVFFLDCVTRSGVRIRSLNIAEASLEMVFLKLTGKRLRDD